MSNLFKPGDKVRERKEPNRIGMVAEACGEYVVVSSVTECLAFRFNELELIPAEREGKAIKEPDRTPGKSRKR